MNDDASPKPVDDAPRRTHLANERTFLAWWRSGLAAVAVGFSVGKFGPIVTHEAHWPYSVLGGGLLLVGIMFIAYGHIRRHSIRDALNRGENVPDDTAMMVFMTGVTVFLCIGLLVLMIATN